MTFSDDHIALAAEYVLGTLDADERAEAEALMLIDTAFADLVRRWELRLGELHAMVDSIEPPAALWDRIRDATGGVAQSEQVLPPLASYKRRASRRAATVRSLRSSSRVRRWRSVATLTGAMAAGACAVHRRRHLPAGSGAGELCAARRCRPQRQASSWPCFSATLRLPPSS